MKKIIITTVLFLMLFSVPAFAGLYNRCTGTCIVEGCDRTTCDHSYYCSSHKCSVSHCRDRRSSSGSGLYCFGHKYKDKKAENNLSKSGYKIVKIPCFSVPNDYTVPKINFMNSVGGTSKKAGTFLITNKSDYPELNDAVANVYKKNGIKNVYFVSTEPLLKKGGGIDCLTQEI